MKKKSSLGGALSRDNFSGLNLSNLLVFCSQKMSQSKYVMYLFMKNMHKRFKLPESLKNTVHASGYFQNKLSEGENLSNFGGDQSSSPYRFRRSYLQRPLAAVGTMGQLAPHRGCIESRQQRGHVKHIGVMEFVKSHFSFSQPFDFSRGFCNSYSRGLLLKARPCTITRRVIV